jgi:hypothetical protein
VSVDQGYGRTSRRYRIPGTDEAYDSVTSIRSAIGKPALITWAANQERAFVMEAAANLHEHLPASAPRMSPPRLSGDASDPARQGEGPTAGARQGGGDLVREPWLHRVDPPPRARRGGRARARISGKALWAFMVWQDWQAAVKLRPLAIEQVVWSSGIALAGTLDFLAEITLPGHAVPVPAVGDIKTGKAIHDEPGSR